MVITNSEAIFYLRNRNLASKFTNPKLGSMIWKKIQEISINHNVACKKITNPFQKKVFNKSKCNENELPQNSTQFEIDEVILTDLYKWFNTLEGI